MQEDATSLRFYNASMKKTERGQVVLRGFDRAVFSRQISGMEIEFLAIRNGAGERAAERVFLRRSVWAAFPSDEARFSVGGVAMVFRWPNLSSSPCAP